MNLNSGSYDLLLKKQHENLVMRQKRYSRFIIIKIETLGISLAKPLAESPVPEINKFYYKPEANQVSADRFDMCKDFLKRSRWYRRWEWVSVLLRSLELTENKNWKVLLIQELFQSLFQQNCLIYLKLIGEKSSELRKYFNCHSLTKNMM